MRGTTRKPTYFFTMRGAREAPIGGVPMNRKPTGKEILSLLIDLLAKQEGVKVKYEIVEKENK